MKRIIGLLFSVLMMITKGYGQKQKFDIATFIPPAGWQRADANDGISFMDSKTQNGLTSFCQIILYTSIASTTDAQKNFESAWQNLVTVPTKLNTKPATQTEKTPDGWTIITGSANIVNQGVTYKTIVANISGFGKTMNVQVNTAGGNYASVLENFFNELNLDSKATVSNNQTNMSGKVNTGDYDFVTPQNWQLQSNNDHIAIANMRSGCVIRILSPQPSSGNLEQDAKLVFEMMYKGWQYQKTGERQFELSKGVLTKGLEYFMKEATMTGYGTDSRYTLEEGIAMVVKAGNQVVIVSVRHNSSDLGHDDCYKNYNTWARFMNSFTVKNISASTNNEEDVAKRILGLWKLNTTGVVLGDYAFAANGNYEQGGGLGSSTTTSDMYYEYIYNRAYPFQGTGSYSISGNLLTLKPRGAAAEQIKIRFEEVNHGGTGWKDRLYLLKTDSRGENETRYEKQEK